MNKEIHNPVKIKVKGFKDNYDITIKARVDGSDAVPLADLFIEQLKARGYKSPGAITTPGENIEEISPEVNKEASPIPVCPIHN